MKSVMDVIHQIADEALSYELMTDIEIEEQAKQAIDLISNFEHGLICPTPLALGKACFILLNLSSDCANYRHWEAVENLYSGVSPDRMKLAVLALRDDYLKDPA